MSIIEGRVTGRILWRNAAAFFAALILCLAAFAIDPKQIEGASVWLKPLKFAVSFGVHVATLALIVAWAQPSSRVFAWSIWAILVTAWAEFLLIALQAARGVRSHFNVESPFDAAVFTAMGVGVGVLFAASVTAAMGLYWDRARRSWPMVVSSAAILSGALGSLTALAMVAPTEAQIAGYAQGVRESSGARFPGGGEPGAAVVPLLGWSLERGDYRISHFWGVHLMQVLLIWGWLMRNAVASRRLNGFAVIAFANAAMVAILFVAASHDVGILDFPIAMVVAMGLSVAIQPVVAVWATSRPQPS